MYLESSPATTRRSPETSRRRGDCRKPTRQTTNAPGERPRREIAAARRSRLDDAIVSQWLLEQLPSDHRTALASVAGAGHP